ARTDVRGVCDDMPVLAFRDCIAALQRREGTEDIETPAERVEAFPLAGDLAGCDGRYRSERPFQECAVRLDPPLQAPRGEPFSQGRRSSSSPPKRLANFADQ